ncbi:hypothetical protein KAI68_00375 [bacterium]|nr:hypothetical protein [bacterium]
MDKQEIEALKRELEGKKEKGDKRDKVDNIPEKESFQGEKLFAIEKEIEESKEEKLVSKVSGLLEKNLKPLERKITVLNDRSVKNIECYKEEVCKSTKHIISSQKKIYRLLFFSTIGILVCLGLGIKISYENKKEIQMLNLNLFTLREKMFPPEVEEKEVKIKKKTNGAKKVTPKNKKTKKKRTKVKKSITKKNLKVSNYVIVSKFKIKRYEDKKDGSSILAKGKIKNISKRGITNVKMNIKLLNNKKKVILERSFNVVAKGEKKVNKGKILKVGYSLPFSVRIGPDRKNWAGKCKYYLSDLVLEKK